MEGIKIQKPQILALRDNNASVFIDVWVEKNIRSAQRKMSEAVNCGKGQLANFPQEFDIFNLGEVDEITGQVTVITPPKMVCNLLSLKKGNENPVK